MHYKYTKIADIKIKIDTSVEIGKIVANQLDAKEDILKDCDLIIKFTDDLKFENEYISSGDNLKYNDFEYLVKFLHVVQYKVNHLFDNKETSIEIKIFNKNFKAKIKELIYGKNNIEVNSILSYSLFWYIFQYKLLQKKRTFLHAGVFSKDDVAFAITGTGGSGKTSNLFKVLEDKEYRYLSEDFAIVDKEGFAYYNPKSVSIYETDMKYNPKILGNYYNYFSLKEKIIWRINTEFLKRDPIVKANPHKLLKNNIVTKSKLKNIFYFVRNKDDKITHSIISRKDLVKRSLNVTLREMKQFVELLFLMEANKQSEFLNMIDFKEYTKNIEEIYYECFSNTKNYIMYVPESFKPDYIVKYMKDFKLI